MEIQGNLDNEGSGYHDVAKYSIDGERIIYVSWRLKLTN